MSVHMKHSVAWIQVGSLPPCKKLVTTLLDLTYEQLDCFHTCDSGELSSIQEDNPLYEEQEIRMEMFQGSDNETEGELPLLLYLLQ